MPARPKKRAAKKAARKKKGARKASARKKSDVSSDHSVRAHAMHNASSSSYWMDCSLWYHLKLECERKGIDYDSENEAAQRGTMQHEVDEQAFAWYREEKFGKNLRRCVEGAAKALAKGHKEKYGLTLSDDDLTECTIAVQAVLDIITPEHEVALEVPIPLSHEPESKGPADVLAYRQDEVAPGQYLLSDLLLADYKHGRIKHSPNGYQLRVYGSNALRIFEEDVGLTLDDDTRIRLAIIQPKHYTEALVKTFTVKELRSFQAYVEHTVERQKNGDKRGASSLSTCDWCDFDRIGMCTHKETLLGNVINSVRMAGEGNELADHLIEEVVRSRNVFKRIIDDCTAKVRDDEKRFPNWTRATVSNGQTWTTLVDDEQISHKLAEAGATDEDVWVMKSPKQVHDATAGHEKASEIAAIIDEYSVEAGTHVRLHFGAPTGSPKKEPKSRPNKKQQKKSAKKKAAKKAAKKKGKKK